MPDSSNQPITDAARPIDLAAYFDGESDGPETAAALEAALRENADLSERLVAHEALRQQLRRLPRAEAPPYLRKKVEFLFSEQDRKRRAMGPVVRWFVAAGIAASVALMVLFGVPNDSAVPSVDAAVYDAMIEDHERYEPAAAGAELMSSDSRELERWLATQLDFSPRLPSWGWVEIQSARVCSLNESKVAFARYRCGGDEVSVYAWPAKQNVASVTTSPRTFTSNRGYELAVWTESGMVYGLVAKRSTGAVERLLNSFD